MTKLFEAEIGRSIQALGKTYSYKPPDIIQAGLPKVDYLFCYKGAFIGIEAKEVKGGSCPVSQFSPGQKQALAEIFESDGVALIAVNFGRIPVRHDPGKTNLWLYGPDGERLPGTMLTESLKLGAGYPLIYKTGRLWDLSIVDSLL